MQKVWWCQCEARTLLHDSLVEEGSLERKSVTTSFVSESVVGE